MSSGAPRGSNLNYGVDQHNWHYRECSCEFHHNGEVSRSLTECVACSNDRRSVVHCGPCPQSESEVAHLQSPSHERKEYHHKNIEQKGCRKRIGYILILCFDDRCDGRDRRASTDSRSCADQGSLSPGDSEQSSNKVSTTEGCRQCECHDHERDGSYLYHLLNAQCHTHADDRHFQ